MPARSAAGEVSTYRKTHGLSAVKLDAKLNMAALKQSMAMAVKCPS